MRSGLAVLAVTGAEHPEAFPGLVLDAEVVPHGDHLGIALPPFAEDPFGSIGAGHLAANAAPSDGDRGMGGQERQRLYRLGPGSRRVGRGQ